MNAQTEVKKRENKQIREETQTETRGRGLGHGRLSETQRDRLAQVLREKETGGKK